MTYISKEFTEDIVLPDGSAASSIYEIERFLKMNNLAAASEYSDDFRREVRFRQECNQRKMLFETFIDNYKRVIWQ